MLRWLFFSSRLPSTWEWWAFRETMIIASAFIGISLTATMLLVAPDAPLHAKIHHVGVLGAMLWMHFWLVRKYSFWTSMIFSWGIGLPTSQLVVSPNMWWSTAFLIVGLACSTRAFSSGPVRHVRQRV